MATQPWGGRVSRHAFSSGTVGLLFFPLDMDSSCSPNIEGEWYILTSCVSCGFPHARAPARGNSVQLAQSSCLACVILPTLAHCGFGVVLVPCIVLDAERRRPLSHRAPRVQFVSYALPI